MKKSLLEIWDELPMKSDKGDLHSYLEVYEELFAPYRDKDINVLELGLFNGASLLLWEKYFSGRVYGVDCSETPHDGMADLRPLINEGTHNIFILDAENSDEIGKAFKGIKFNICIEDCGHHIEQQLKIYEVIKPYMAENSLYCIEDVQSIDDTMGCFKGIDTDKEITILDRRQKNNRYDDVVVIIKK